MNKHAGKLIFILLGSAAALTAGCDSAKSDNKDGGADTGAPAGTKVPVMPDDTGWVDKTGNTVMIQGAWYSYGDLADCMGAGHAAAECSKITTPLEGSFMNTGGKMCTSGTAAKVLNNSAGMADYSMMWGAGIALDLNASGGASSVKMPYNAAANKVIGFSFTIDSVPLGADGLRVEMPTPTTRNTAFFKTLLSTNTGAQTVLFSDMKQGTWVPATTPPTTFDATMIESVQFHVPTNTTAAVPYMFCISDFSAIVTP